MAVYFFDTSALVKYYHEESGRPKVVDLIEDPASSIHISRLSHVEWHSAFARHVRTGAVSAEEFHRLRGRFYADLKTGKFQTVPLHNTHLQRASRLLSTHALTRGLRTLDALQLAIALDLHRTSPLDAFVCADANFCNIVQQENISVINPEAA